MNTLSIGYFKNDTRDFIWRYWGIEDHEPYYPAPIIKYVNILDKTSVIEYIKMVEQLKIILKNDSLHEFSNNLKPVITATILIDEGKFDDNFIFELYESKSYHNESVKIKGTYVDNKLDSILTKLETELIFQLETKSAGINQIKYLSIYESGKKNGWSNRYENINDKGFNITTAEFYKNDSLLERHDYTCVDRGGENEHAYTKYENGFPVLIAMVDSSNHLPKLLFNFGYRKIQLQPFLI